nr:mitogen-activated protein kinase hog1 [Quercus suber]
MAVGISEGSEYHGESGKTYLAVSALGQAKVWTAVEKTDPSNIVVLKSPSPDDTRAGWPHFQHEMIMHELFKDSKWIRKQVDRIPASNDSTNPPILVLEILEGTLWAARSKRPFTKGEVRAVARSILYGLTEVHAKGLVYADLKMQNIMVSGFDADTPGDGSNIVTKLGDLGIVMGPSMGKVQPVAYRAPEIHLKYQITEAADIWGFALVYCHLLEAQNRFTKTGLYDDLDTGRGTMPEREDAAKLAVSNDYDLFDVEYYQDCSLPCNDPSHEPGRHWQELKKRGLDDEEIEFLKWVLKADPTRRPTASAILASKWFGESSDALAASMSGKEVSMPDSSTSHSSVAQAGTPQTTPQTALNSDGAQALDRKDGDEVPQDTSPDSAAPSAAPFLPWVAKTESTKNGAAEESGEAARKLGHESSDTKPTQSSLQESSKPTHQDADIPTPATDDKAAAPFLPWLQTSSHKEYTPEANKTKLPEQADVASNDMESSSSTPYVGG